MEAETLQVSKGCVYMYISYSPHEPRIKDVLRQSCQAASPAVKLSNPKVEVEVSPRCLCRYAFWGLGFWGNPLPTVKAEHHFVLGCMHRHLLRHPSLIRAYRGISLACFLTSRLGSPSRSTSLKSKLAPPVSQQVQDSSVPKGLILPKFYNS